MILFFFLNLIRRGTTISIETQCRLYLSNWPEFRRISWILFIESGPVADGGSNRTCLWIHWLSSSKHVDIRLERRMFATFDAYSNDWRRWRTFRITRIWICNNANIKNDWLSEFRSRMSTEWSMESNILHRFWFIDTGEHWISIERLSKSTNTQSRSIRKCQCLRSSGVECVRQGRCSPTLSRHGHRGRQENLSVWHRFTCKSSFGNGFRIRFLCYRCFRW